MSKNPKEPEVQMCCDAARQIRQHARGSSKTEVCGVLVGSESDNVTSIEASIPGANAAQGGTHVTFTQDTWEHIYKIKDRDYPQARIVGWYHSHPGFGVFLSDHDTFIHKNFFSSPRQVAWVYDPHSDEEGCFGWVGKRLERLSRIVFVDQKGGEGAGETGQPEPLLFDTADEGPSSQHEPEAPIRAGTAALRTASVLIRYLTVFLAGFLLSWFLFPRYVLPIDPRTGQLMDPRTGQPLFSFPAGRADRASPDPNDARNANHPVPPATPAPAPQDGKGKP